MTSAKLVTMISEWVAIFGGIFAVIIAAFFAKPQQQNYLRRVAKKYSIRPLDLR